MTHQLPITVLTGADIEGMVTKALATLPLSFRNSSRGDVVIASGKHSADDANSVSETLLGLLIVAPTAQLAGDLPHDIPVVVDAGWNYSPAAISARTHFEGLPGEAEYGSSLDLPLDADLETRFLAHLALVRASISAIRDAHVIRWDSHGYDVRAHMDNGANITLSAAKSNAKKVRAELWAITATNRIVVNLPSPLTADRGTVTVSSPDGSTLLPTAYETSTRVALRELHRRITRDRRLNDLQAIYRDIQVLRTALS